MVDGLSFFNQILLRFSASGQEMGGSILFKQRRDHPLGKIGFFFSVERTFGCRIFAIKRLNTTLQRSSD